MDSANYLPNKTHLISGVNEYVIVKVLGQGGFGIVYEGLDRQRNRVAIKEYFPSSFVTRARDTYMVSAKDDRQDTLAFFTKGVKRFYEEAQTMKRFHADKNIVSVEDFFYANGTAYIVMEFIDGRTFMDVLKAMPQSRLTLSDVVANIHPVVEALEKIHGTSWQDDESNSHSGLIHRDISPDNIMFAGDGSVKLLDFGAARTVSMQGEYELTGIVKPGYAPVEQFIGSGVAGAQGPWTDVYALAATIYRAITGIVPPSSLQRQAKDMLKSPSALGVAVSPRQEAILLKGLAMDYRERYQTVRQFFNELSNSLADVPLQPSLPKKSMAGVKSLFGGAASAGNHDGKAGKFSLLVAAIACAAAVFSYASMNVAARDLDDARQYLADAKTHLERYSDIEAHYGRGSSFFYSEVPILVLKAGGATGRIPIYWGNSQGTDDHAYFSAGSKNITVKWASGSFQNNSNEVIVTSGSVKGYYTLYFVAESSDDSFDVLVVVK